MLQRIRTLAARPILVLAFLTAAAAAAGARSTAGRLEGALETVRADNIRSDEFFIASDELAGRDTPSVGQRVAARYIRARLERLGWKPGAKDGYFFPYQLEQRKLDEDLSKIAWKRGEKQGELKFGSDYYFASTFDLRELSAEGGVVFCGPAGKADFEKSGVSGKWALCLDDGMDPKKLRAPAHQAGAIGVLVAEGQGYSGEAYEKRFGKDLERMRKGSVYPKRKPSPDDDLREPRKDDSIPIVLLAKGGLAQCLEAAGFAQALPAVGADLGLTLSETRKVAGPIEVEDVCGFWPGSDPALAKETILVSAHYDHVGVQHGKIYNGADDNGSGTCGLMAIAEALANYGPMKRSVMLIWVSGEEKGLWGSAAWTKDPWIPQDGKPICDINIDMIGRNAPDKLLITPTRALPQYNGLVRIAEKVSPLEGFPTLGSCDEYWTRSDHMNFSQNLKIPVTFLFSDVHEDYHQPTDKPEKIDNDKIRRVARMVLRMLEELQAEKLDL